MADMTTRDGYFSGGGKLYFAPITDGVEGALTYFGRTEGVTLTSAISYKDAYNNEGSTKLLGKRLASQTDVSVTFTTDQIDVDSLAIAFKANKIAQTQAVGTAVAVTTSAVTSGGFYDLGLYNITTLVVQDATDTTTYTAGTDYVLHANSGLLEIVADGAISTGDILHLSATYPEYNYTGLATFKTSTLEGKLIVINDSDTRNDYKWIIKRVSLQMDGDLSLKNADAYGMLSFSGSALVDTATVSDTWSDYMDIIPINPKA